MDKKICVDNIRYFRAEMNLNSVIGTIRIRDIPLPTVQNSNQVYVSVTILDNVTSSNIFTQIVKIVKVAPVNTMTIRITLTSMAEPIGDVTIEGLIFVAPNATPLGTVTISGGTLGRVALTINRSFSTEFGSRHRGFTCGL